MKRKTRFFVPVLVVLALAMASGFASFADPFDLDSAEEVKSLSGSIEYSRTWGFTLSTASGERFRLLMHPMRFLDETKLSVGAKDRVSVSGYKMDEDAIWVTTISKGSATYEIADPDDRPWRGAGPRRGNRSGLMRGPGGGYGDRGWNDGDGPGRDEDFAIRGDGWCR